MSRPSAPSSVRPLLGRAVIVVLALVAAVGVGNLARRRSSAPRFVARSFPPRHARGVEELVRLHPPGRIAWELAAGDRAGRAGFGALLRSPDAVEVFSALAASDTPRRYVYGMIGLYHGDRRRFHAALPRFDYVVRSMGVPGIHLDVHIGSARDFRWYVATLDWPLLEGLHALEHDGLTARDHPPRSMPYTRHVRCDLSGLDLRGWDLTRGDFYRTDFTGARLDGATLTECLLNVTRLDGASLAGADLDGAWLAGAHARGTSFAGAHRLESAELANLHCWDAATTWPGGFAPVELERACDRDAPRYGAK